MYCSFDPTTLAYLLVGFFAVAALGVALAVVAVADLVRELPPRARGPPPVGARLLPAVSSRSH